MGEWSCSWCIFAPWAPSPSPGGGRLPWSGLDPGWDTATGRDHPERQGPECPCRTTDAPVTCPSTEAIPNGGPRWTPEPDPAGDAITLLRSVATATPRGVPAVGHRRPARITGDSMTAARHRDPGGAPRGHDRRSHRWSAGRHPGLEHRIMGRTGPTSRSSTTPPVRVRPRSAPATRS